MNTLFKSIIKQLPPFIVLGIAIALMISLLIFFSYVVLWGLLVGGVLWIIMAVKQFLFPENTPPQKESRIAKKKEGRVIEHEERDKK